MVSGCAGEEASISLRLLYPVTVDGAAPPERWKGDGCGSEVEPGQCVSIKLRACQCTDRAAPCPPPTDPDCTSVFTDPADVEQGHLANVQGGTFDLPTETATRKDMHLQIGMYADDGRLLATGEARNIAFGDEQSVGLSLFPVSREGHRGTACPREAGASVDTMRKRTFHTTTLLPNGTVLIVGGFTGQLVNTLPATNSLNGGDEIEVLDPRTGEVVKVTDIRNEAPGEEGVNLSRAFHHAAYLGTDEQDRYRVRLFGGIRSPRGAAQSVIVSRTREGMPLQLLFSGAAEPEDAEPAPPVDLHFDPSTPESVTITDAGADSASYPKASFGGFAVLTAPEAEPGVVTGGYYLGGGLGAWTEAQEAADNIPPMTKGFFLGANGGTRNATPADLRVGRVGTTALGIGEDEVLFWGGNVWSVDGSADPEADIAAEMAEILPTGGNAPELVTVTGAEIPLSTAFHAAAVAAVDSEDVFRIVVAGGYLVGPLEAVGTQFFASIPLYLVSYDKSARTADVTEVDCGADPCTEVFGDVAYLTATVVEPGKVLLVGGNFLYDGPSRVSFGARAIAGVVTVTGQTAVFERVELGEARYGHTATRLLDGSILILGGVTLPCAPNEEEGGECGGFADLRPLDNYEIYNEGLEFDPDRLCTPVE